MKPLFAPPSTDSGLPVSLCSNLSISTWLKIDKAQRCINIYSGKVELGQNILTAIAQIAAHELCVPIDAIRMMAATTGTSPDESVTSGSLSIQHSGMSVRLVCRQVRHMFIGVAASRSGVKHDTIVVRGGEFHAGDTCCGSYWELAGEVDLDVDLNPQECRPARDAVFLAASQTSLGLAQKTRGRYGYIHDMKVPGVIHGRMLRPPSINAKLLRLDTSVLAEIEGIVAIAQDGSLVGVLAEKEYIAERAVAQLAGSAIWQEAPCLPEQHELASWMRTQKCDTTLYSQDVPRVGTPAIAKTYAADYFKSFIKHASIGPSCSYALTDPDGGLSVWTHSQGIYNLRADLAIVFELAESNVLVQHVPGAGCYGHNGADDVAFDAAWLSRYVKGKTVRVQWSRADELCWAPQGPAMSISIQADVDRQGRIVDWRHQVWSPGHSLRPGRAATSTLLGAWYRKEASPILSAINAPISAGGGAERNIIPSYDIQCSSLASHRLLKMPVRTSSLRCLGAFGNVFAIESMLDDIALDHDADPIDYRLGIVSDPRAIEVLQAVRDMSGWDKARNADEGDGDGVVGWGVGFARYKNKGGYCAVVAQVVVAQKIAVKKLFITVDVGEVINPDGVVQQIEGGAIQATSWATIESVHFNENALIDDSWETYPIIRFSDVPQVDVHILSRPDQPALGAGEVSLAPTAAAIGNAVKNALGVRVYTLPLTFEQVSLAIEDSV